MILVVSILGQQDCRCGVEYKPTNSGGIDYIVGGSEINIVSRNSLGGRGKVIKQGKHVFLAL